MQRITLALALSSILVGTSTWAQDQMTDTSVTTREEVVKGSLKDETYSIKPLAGVMAFQNSIGESTSRAAVGVTAEMNALPLLNKTMTNWYFGPSVGLIYSHVGDPSSDFFGVNAPTSAGQASANLAVIPTDLKLGYNISDRVRVSAHGGGNVTYRTVGNSVNLGGGSTTTTGSLWRWYPNAGADLDLSLGPKVGLTLRPDWTLAPQSKIFTAMLGLGIFVG